MLCCKMHIFVLLMVYSNEYLLVSKDSDDIANEGLQLSSLLACQTMHFTQYLQWNMY